MPPIPLPVLGQVISHTTFGVPVATQLNGQYVQMGLLSGTTNAAGGIGLTFPKAFAAAPIVVACDGSSAAAGIIIVGIQPGISASAVGFVCRRTDLANTPPAVSIAVNVLWIAIGSAPLV